MAALRTLDDVRHVEYAVRDGFFLIKADGIALAIIMSELAPHAQTIGVYDAESQGYVIVKGIVRDLRLGETISETRVEP